MMPTKSPLAPDWLQRGRVPCLDGLRAVSIALVLLEHASLARGFPIGPHQFSIGHVGRLGVSMFFAISGFLITMLLVREWERTGAISMRGFYWRRALRILPAYIMFLLVVFVMNRAGVAAMTPGDWVGVLTYTVNFIKEPSWIVGHVWSLSVEEQFYLVWPVLVMSLSPARARFVVLAYLVSAPLVRLGIWAFWTGHLHIIDELTPLRLDAIAAGCLLALLAWDASFRTRIAAAVPPRAARLLPGAAMVGIAASFAMGERISAYGVSLSYSVEAFFMVTIIWFQAVSPNTPLGRILETRPLVLVGLLSYSLYLWQQPFMTPHVETMFTLFPLNIVLAGCAAAASYYLIELPFLRIKDRKHDSRRVQPIPAADAPAASASIRGATEVV